MMLADNILEEAQIRVENGRSMHQCSGFQVTQAES